MFLEATHALTTPGRCTLNCPINVGYFLELRIATTFY